MVYNKKGIEHDKDPKAFIEDPSDLKNYDQVFGVFNWSKKLKILHCIQWYDWKYAC